MESVKKNIECVLGIMKKRHGILQAFQHHLMSSIDAVICICCIVHNQLLEKDKRSDIGEYESSGLLATSRRPTAAPQILSLGENIFPTSHPCMSPSARAPHAARICTHHRYNEKSFKVMTPDTRLDVTTSKGDKEGCGDTYTGKKEGVVEDVDPGFADKRQMLVQHFKLARAAGEARWPAPSAVCHPRRHG